MKSFDTNFIPQNIVLNAKISYSFDNSKEPILVAMPTIRDSIEDINFNLFLSLLFLKVEDYEKMRLKMKVETPTQGFLALIRESRDVREQIQPYIEKYLIGGSLSVSGIQIGERILTAEEVEYFIKIMLVSFGVEEYKKEKEKEDFSHLSEAERKILERQQKTLERLEAAKKRKEEVRSKDGQIDLPKIIVGVMKEFHMSLEEIKNLNYYTLYYLFSYVFKIDHYDFMKQAAASGNLAKKTKITHWLE